MAETSPVEMGHDLGHYLRPLRRHLVLILGITILGLFLGLLGAVTKQPNYIANSRVNVQSDITDSAPNPSGSRTNGAVNMDAEAQFLKSLPTATIAGKLLHTDAAPTVLASHVTATVVLNTDILKIAYTAHTAGDAIAGANAFANGYLQARAANANDFQEKQIATLQAQLASTRADLVRDTAAYRSASAHSAAKHEALSKESSDNQRINTLALQLGQVQAASLQPGAVVSEGVLGSTSSNQGRILLVLAGLVLGLLAGIGVASLRERLDKTVRYEDDLSRDGVRLLAEISSRRGKKEAGEADSRLRARAVQRLAASIGAALGDSGGSIYLATLSTNAIDDRLDEQLATELSRFGSTTEIVTLGAALADYPSPSGTAELAPAQVESPALDAAEVTDAHHGQNGQNGQNGRAKHNGHENTRQLASISGEMLGWPVPGAALAPFVPEPPPPITKPEPSREVAELSPVTVSPVVEPAPPTDAVSSLLHEVQAGLARARYVILTSTDVPYGSDAYVLASLSQVTVVVAEVATTTRADLADSIEQIAITPSRILGGLLWRARPNAARSDNPTATARRTQGREATTIQDPGPMRSAAPTFQATAKTAKPKNTKPRTR